MHLWTIHPLIKDIEKLVQSKPKLNQYPVSHSNELTEPKAKSTEKGKFRVPPKSIESRSASFSKISRAMEKARKVLSEGMLKIQDAKNSRKPETAKPVIDEIVKLKADTSSGVRQIIPEFIAYVSYFHAVWNLFGDVLKEIIDELCKDENEGVRKEAQDVRDFVLNRKEEWDASFAKGYKDYVQLANHARPGKLESERLLKAGNLAFARPEGYTYAEKKDIPKPFQPFFNPETGLIEDPETTLKAALFKGPDGEMVLAFSGTEYGMNERTIRGWGINLLQTWGEIPPIFDHAQILAKTVNDKYPGKSIFVGHSQGGALAQYAGIPLGRPTICINSMGMGFGVREKLMEQLESDGKRLPEEAFNGVSHIYLEGEFASFHRNEETNAVMGGFPLGKIFFINAPETMEKEEKTGILKSHSVFTVWEVLNLQTEQAKNK